MNDIKEFATIKIYSNTAKRLKKFAKKKGLTIAAFASIVINKAISEESKNKQ